MEVKKLAEMSAAPESGEQIIQTDIMRYKRNKTAANFALLSLVFECLYFMVFYSLNLTAFNTVTIGLSVVINLCVLLITFYAEECIKNYNYKFSIVLLVLAAVQIVRIFYYPIKILNTLNSNGEDIFTYFFFHTMGKIEFSIVLIVFLVCGAACLIASAFFGYVRAKKLENFNKALNEGTISVEAALKEADEKDAQEVANA